jgi:hypothetical protein
MRKISLFALAVLLACNSLGAQDRNISVSEVYPSDMFIENGGRLINVKTSLTHLDIGPNAMGDGINDDSDAIIAAMDWVMDQLKAWYAGGGGVHWHKYYIIYFPDGVYKVSKPLVYSGARVIDPLYSTAHDREGVQKLMLVGQSRENTIIRLVDNASGFGSTARQPVVSYSRFDLGTTFNNMPAANEFRNFTIDTGSGNPGAIGLDFYGANVARLDNIKIVGSGKIGCAYQNRLSTWLLLEYNCRGQGLRYLPGGERGESPCHGVYNTSESEYKCHIPERDIGYHAKGTEYQFSYRRSPREQ